MNIVLKSVITTLLLGAAAQAAAQVVFYERAEFDGRSFNTERNVSNFAQFGFNDRASSAVVMRDNWEVCEDASFRGKCIVLRPGRYPSLSSMGMNNRVSSVRVMQPNARYNDDRYAPAATPVYDNRRRKNERLFQADVASVRAVVGPDEQRCWVEQEQVTQDRGAANVPGAIIGGILGGVLGHQVGGGRGRDVATVAGVVAGGAVGANVGRNGSTQTQDVRRCVTEPSRAATAYWDVSYRFDGKDHVMQMTSQPGRTVTVNAEGEPRS